ncbi:MAG: mandelate racemase/muconate lactonizing enzyme family protein [Anaerolineales bacterium]
MQITKCEVTPVELKLRMPVQMAGHPEIAHVTAIFVRIETKEGRNAWGCAIAHPSLTGETPEHAIRACQDCASMAPDLHPINIEYSLEHLSKAVKNSTAARCAFDLAFYDLLGLAASMPLHRLLGGYRNSIQTSATIPVSTRQESVEIAQRRAKLGFRMLKVKGGLDPEEDVRRVRAIHRVLPKHILRLDADGGYSVQDALEVGRALKDELEMLEQPTAAGDLEGLREVTRNCPVPVLADQSVRGPTSALELATQKAVDGMSVKVATCSGLHCARQVDSIARAARIATMVSCVIEPALMISAGLCLALSSPNVQYGDLDGNLDILNDPTVPSFHLEDGWLVASEVPGLGCTVELS